ncbi:Werner syndrome ATP-dependent helicase, partial [Leucoagaricus sp. SymC.cos]
DICCGRWQIVIISPEMLLSKRFISSVIRNREFIPRILAVVIDEAHVVSHWGADFRKAYGRLGILRALLPRHTPFVAMSATMPPRVRSDVITKLNFTEDEFASLDLGNDRPNVSMIVCPIHNPMNTYSDLQFVIPKDTQHAHEIKKTFIYADRIEDGYAIEDYLTKCLPESLRRMGLVRPYSAAYTSLHRAHVMALFKAGDNQGCNIPDIDLVVQWKLPGTLSSFIQRAGRAARSHKRSGVAILLAERSAFKADLETAATAGGDKPEKVKKKTIRQQTSYPRASNDYALKHGIRRGTHNGAYDGDALAPSVPIDYNAIDEGLYSLVQATTHNTEALNRPSTHKGVVPVTTECCDICSSNLLDSVRPAPPAQSTTKRGAAIRKKVPVDDIMDALHEWRMSVWQRDFSKSFYPPSIILNDQDIERLASAGPFKTIEELGDVQGENWPWFSKYADELLAKLRTMEYPLSLFETLVHEKLTRNARH